MKHILEWSEGRREWWVTSYNEAGEAVSGRDLKFFLQFDNHEETLDKFTVVPVDSK